MSIDCLRLISFSYSGVVILTLALNFEGTNIEVGVEIVNDALVFDIY